MSISTATTAVGALSNFLLVSPQSTIGYQPQPTVPFAPDSPIIFNYEGENTASIESDITDHYVEDNTAIQDQIALRPEMITTHGYVGELNDIPANAVLAALQLAAKKLTVLSAYTPELSITAQLAYAEAAYLYSVGAAAVSTAQAAIATIGNTGESVIGSNGLKLQPRQTKQQQAFQRFYGYWRSRTLFTVQTPWAVFQNMAIKNLRAIQNEDTNTITDFEVTFKMIRFASTLSLSPTGPITIGVNSAMQGQAAAQGAALADIGTSTPIPSAIPFSPSLVS